MNTQVITPEETGKGVISLGVMLRRVAEGKMSFEAALESPFSYYFLAIHSLNIPSCERKRIFMFFLSKVVRMNLPLQSEAFIPLFYKMETLYQADYIRISLPQNHPAQNMSLSEIMTFGYPSYSYVLEELKVLEKRGNASSCALRWELILKTAVKYAENQQPQNWWQLVDFLSVGRGLDALPEPVFQLIVSSYFEKEKRKMLVNYVPVKKIHYTGFYQLITFFLTYYTGKWFPMEKMENLMTNPAFFPNFSRIYTRFGGENTEKGLSFLPEFALTLSLESDEDTEWFCALANGQNITEIRQPYLRLTKKMAQWFMVAPKGSSFHSAIKYGYLKGSAVSDLVLNTILNTQAVPATQELWDMFLYILKTKESETGLSRENLAQIGPMIDYINHEYRQNPTYSLKGRSWNSLVTRMEAWHVQYRYGYQQYYQWKPGVFEPLEYQEGEVVYKVFELTDSYALTEESMKMSHCVYSYAYSCYTGQRRIFSVRKYLKKEEEVIEVERMLTVELRSFSIVQARKRFNAFPTSADQKIVHLWMNLNPQIKWLYS